MAFVALFGHWFGIPELYAPLPGGGTFVATAVGLIVSSLGLVLSFSRGQKVDIARITFAVIILLIGLLAFLGYIVSLPVLYSLSSFARLSVPTAICFMLFGSALFWAAWRQL